MTDHRITLLAGPSALPLCRLVAASAALVRQCEALDPPDGAQPSEATVAARRARTDIRADVADRLGLRGVAGAQILELAAAKD